jgi:WXG100 family type VII secretion target
VVDQVAGLPGGQELSALAQQIQGDPGGISSIAGVWSSAAASSAAQTQDFAAKVKQIQASWAGNGSDSFGNFAENFIQASQQVNQALGTASEALSKAASALEQAQGNVNSILQQVSSDASQLQADITQLQNAKKDASNLEAELASLAKTATPKVRNEIQKAEQELETVISDLNEAIDAAEGTFSALPVPAGGSTNPSFSSGGGVSLAGTAAGGSAAGGSGGASIAPGGGIPGLTSGSGFNNEVAVAKYLVAHGYSKAAAAGIASCIDGESAGDPEAVGTGGCGLIGWTPPSSLEQYGGTCAAAGIGNNSPSVDLANQMRAIVNYNNANGNVAALNSISNPVQAADYYSQNFERPLVTDSDVRANVATAVFNALGG